LLTNVKPSGFDRVNAKLRPFFLPMFSTFTFAPVSLPKCAAARRYKRSVVLPAPLETIHWIVFPL
jgi:hypothetical protein